MVYQSRAQGQFRNLHRRNEATRSKESRGKGTERRKRSSISAEATESSSRRNNCLQFHHRTNSRRHRSPAVERNIECLRLERIAGVAGGEGRARQDHLDGILAGPLAESRSSLVEAQRFNELANRNRFPATNHLTRERERKKWVYSWEGPSSSALVFFLRAFLHPLLILFFRHWIRSTTSPCTYVSRNTFVLDARNFFFVCTSWKYLKVEYTCYENERN